jgi:P27 family predicted phage terminase small subunit
MTVKKAKTDKLPAPPSTITPEAADWWNRIVSAYGIADESGLLMLRSAMESYDRANAAAAILAKEGLTYRDKYNQFRPHPAVGIERDARKNLLAFLRALNLDVEPLHSKPGRPPGR